jgi:hypothetical protein
VARTGPKGPVRISSQHGPAGIDQTVLIPRRPFTITMRGRVISGEARLVLGWSENGRVRERERALKLNRGSQTHRFRLPRGTQPLQITIGIVQLSPGGTIELDEIALHAGGRQRLHNGELEAEKCRQSGRRDLIEECLVRRQDPVHPDFVPVALMGWRDRYEPTAIVVARDTPKGPVRISSERGPAGIDQTVLIPRHRFTITVRGKVISGEARLVVGWSENGRVRERERALKLNRGSQTHRFRLLRGTQPLQITVGIVQLGLGGTIELDEVALHAGGSAALRNSHLTPHLCIPMRPLDFTEACVAHSRPRDQNHLLVIVPGWRERYEQMATFVERARMKSISPPVQFSGDRPAGIDQSIRVPRSPLVVTVYGRRGSGRLILILTWTESGIAREQERELKLLRGKERHRFVLPRGGRSLPITVGIVQPDEGESASLDAVELESAGQQRLENAHLYADDCPPSPKRPDAAFAQLAWIRVASTFALLTLLGFAIRKTVSLRELRP